MDCWFAGIGLIISREGIPGHSDLPKGFVNIIPPVTYATATEQPPAIVSAEHRFNAARPEPCFLHYLWEAIMWQRGQLPWAGWPGGRHAGISSLYEGQRVYRERHDEEHRGSQSQRPATRGNRPVRLEYRRVG